MEAHKYGPEVRDPELEPERAEEPDREPEQEPEQEPYVDPTGFNEPEPVPEIDEPIVGEEEYEAGAGADEPEPNPNEAAEGAEGAAQIDDQAWWSLTAENLLQFLPSADAAEMLSQMSAADLRSLRLTSVTMRDLVDARLSDLLRRVGVPSPLPALVRRDNGTPAALYFTRPDGSYDIPGLLRDFNSYQLNRDFRADAIAGMDRQFEGNTEAGMRVLRIYYRADPDSGYLRGCNAVARAYITALLDRGKIVNRNGETPRDLGMTDDQAAEEFCSETEDAPKWTLRNST